MSEIKVEPDFGSIPEKNTKYWYVRGCMQTHRFKVCECDFNGSMSDALRLAKGNCYLNQEEAISVMMQLNRRVDALADILDQRHVLEERKREQERIAKDLSGKTENIVKKPKKNKVKKPKKKPIHPDLLP